MELKGKITIFPELKEKENDKGEVESFIVCRGTISSKNGEAYVNKSVNVVFAGKNFPKEKVSKLDPKKCYSLEITEGFLGVREIITPNGSRRDFEIVVLNGKLTGSKEVIRKEVEVEVKGDDLPF